MLVVGFVVLYLGVLGGYFAAAGTGAILAFVLPVTISAPISSIPARLEGWGLAAGAAICAVMLLWPARSRDTLGPQAARACLALADLGDSRLAGDRAAIEARARAAREAVDGLRRGFLGTPHRPTGPTGPTAALAALVDELDWLQSFLVPAVEGKSLELCREENAEALATSVAVLRASAATLEGQSERPDLEGLDAAREAVTQALARRISELPRDEDLESALEPSFRIRVLSYSAREVATYALLAAGAEAPELEEQDNAWRPRVTRPAREALQATEQVAVEHASARSVWFRNSIRGAVGLAVAVFIAQRTGLQHAFWVVLGTLSVLRSNALATGSSIVSALAGTAVGILVGAALVIAIGTHETVLWAVLPVAVLLAAYAPRAISFAAGQAGFTVVLFVLFNLIQPVGWEVGVVRIEDVAIGFAISLGVGLLFWPRGAASLLRENLASAYARSADYVVAMTRKLIDRDDASPNGAEQRPRRPCTSSRTPFASTSPTGRRRTWASRTWLRWSPVRHAFGARRSHSRRSAASPTRATAWADAARTSTGRCRHCARGTSPWANPSPTPAPFLRRMSETRKAGGACSSACATQWPAVTTRSGVRPSSCCGRASTSTPCGVSRRTLAGTPLKPRAGRVGSSRGFPSIRRRRSTACP
jgi:uncharacterized membrane protein YccC